MEEFEAEHQITPPAATPAAATSGAASSLDSPLAVPEEKLRAETEDSHPVNGLKTPDEDDSVNDEGFDDALSPPPDTLDSPSPMSSASPPPNNERPEDEIVVGINANSRKPTSPRPMSNQEDREMEDLTGDRQPVTSHYPKRKRSSVYHDLSEDRLENSLVGDETEVVPKAAGRPRTHGLGSVKGVNLGYWRDSPLPDPKDKHAVMGFIDVRDRLRTRIQSCTRDGREIGKENPCPPGPGGSWVTFERVVFEEHLVNLDQHQVKEYVKIRTENIRPDETEEEAQEADKAAVREAIRRVQANPPPDSAAAPPIAYGVEIPEHAQLSHRPEAKKRRLVAASSAPPTPANGTNGLEQVMNTAHAVFDSLPGTRPTRILLGYWMKSSEPEPDQHAVYGILGANDMFRIKVTRETRDGRPVTGNFPTGAGALWIAYEDLAFEPHLQGLSRPEIKEYVRVRQRQLDDGEPLDLPKEERQAQELKAVAEAHIRAVAAKKVEPRDKLAADAAALLAQGKHGHVYREMRDEPLPASPPAPSPTKRDASNHELRHSRRSETAAAKPARHSLPDTAELRAANRPSSVDAIERANHIARREIARVEAIQARNDQREASRDVASTRTGDNKILFQDHLSRLNKVWVSQEANRLKAGAEDAKIYMGIKYERKRNGPFEGKLVSQGTIISIDGEDYVEYRVLTKPSFF
ncbi:tRNA splicing endonuclease subunit [Pleurostoma richardsiae]|uniref:tRNA splicing endonuclease subunit n=1 Tax=Pleurostoma richardsiae TaxID=41990 RepID=A0AA38VLJ9_9PEZI|nr:tRNA splicing endonuclease subunit [Pleurostoma richardsiae]